MSTSAGLDLVHSFLVVADELNFRRGAERLHVDQSALSRRIQKLEHVLQFKLLERSTRDVSLTQAGRSFYESNAYLLSRYAESIRSARRIAQGKSGNVRVAYMAFAATELMPSAVARFQRAHPHVEVSLRYIRTQGQKLALANDEIDVGYLIGPFDHSDYYSLALSSEALYVVTPRNHALLRKTRVIPRDLADQNLIMGDMAEWAEYRRRTDDLFSTEGVELSIAQEASNTLALIGLVAAGIGVTVFPESLVGFLGRSVEVRPIVHAEFRSQTVLTWKKSNQSKQVQSFVDVARHIGPRL